MLVAKSYKQTLVTAIVFAEAFTLIGLVMSFYLNLRPGGTIVLLGVVTLTVLMFVKGNKD